MREVGDTILCDSLHLRIRKPDSYEFVHQFLTTKNESIRDLKGNEVWLFGFVSLYPSLIFCIIYKLS
nr:MAG TPA: hypothetical protein [Caudoviricetes sp.]DAW73241.1 MAG TPA: hypothetical protein [Caudoviricetes sp.]